MKTQWYIPEPSTHHDSSNAHKLIWVLEEMGCEVLCNEYVSFGGMDYSFLDPSRPVVLYGHLGVIRHYQFGRHKLPPFCWCDFDQLKCSTYYAWWGEFLLQRRYAMMPLGEIARSADMVFETFSREDKVFIRPDDNMKTFVGQVVSRNNFDSWHRHHVEYKAGKDCLCVVSRPEKIDAEWRFVVKDGNVVTGSRYMSDGCIDIEEGFPNEAAEKVEEIAASQPLWTPHPIYVMDICLSESEFRLMEIGSINAAGLYKCDLRRFAQAVEEVVQEEFMPVN